jgi:hypothetical protein
MEQGCHLLSVMNGDIAFSIFSFLNDASLLALLCRTNKKFYLCLGGSKGGGVHWQKALEKWLFKLAFRYCPDAGDISVVKTILGTNVNVNARDKYGLTALFFVHSAEIADMLCKAGVDPNAKNEFGQTALMFKAVVDYDIDIARVLIENGCDINSTDNKKSALLHLLIKNQHCSMSGIQATFIAAVTALVALGADVNAVDRDGNTPMQVLWSSMQVDRDTAVRVAGILRGGSW